MKCPSKGFSLILFIAFLIACFPINSIFAKELYTVTEVIDGDTLIIDNNQTIRLIGVDAPELDYPGESVRYFAKEAYNFTKELCEGKKVRLEFDEANLDNNHKGKYNRTLAYIYLEDGTFINAEIVKQGYGFCYSGLEFRYLDEFRQYQIRAIKEERGLWRKIIDDKEAISLIMNYRKIDESGKKVLKEYLDQRR